MNEVFAEEAYKSLKRSASAPLSKVVPAINRDFNIILLSQLNSWRWRESIPVCRQQGLFFRHPQVQRFTQAAQEIEVLINGKGNSHKKKGIEGFKVKQMTMKDQKKGRISKKKNGNF